MANIRDRIILIPRYTTYAGASSFTTEPLNVSAYESGDVLFWLGKIVGPAPGNSGVTVRFEESSDQMSWTLCGGTSTATLTPSSEWQFTPTFTKAWFRLKITLNTADANEPVATCYATGYLERRR